MWYKARRARNWLTAMAILFAVMAVIILLRDIALFGTEFVGDFFVSPRVTNEKFVLAMFVIAAVLFAFGLRKGEDFYS
ncbi:MAG: hypothetical protein ACE5J2_08545 [Nitrososphaerales archaeon]